MVASTAPATLAPLEVARSSFEEAFSYKAPGWNVNEYGGAISRLGKSNDAATGTGSQSFTLISKGTGDSNLLRGFPMKQGYVYQVSVKYKLPVGKSAVMMLRHDAQPWNSIAQQTVQGNGQWQQLTLKAAFPHADALGSFRVAHKHLDTPILIDDFQMVESKPNLMTFSHGQPVSPLFTGIHVNRLGTHNAWPALGVKMMRLHDTGTTWGAMQPTDAPVDFSTNAAARRLDYYVFSYRRPDVALMYTFTNVPKWAALDPTRTDYRTTGVADLESFRRFVRQIGTRYKGHIRYWEMWNESNYSLFWTGGPVHLAELTRVAAEELKAIDPENKIVAANVIWNGQHFLEDYLDAGARDHVDVLSYHHYTENGPVANAVFHYNMRELAARHGLSHLPIWNTEGDATCTEVTPLCAGVDLMQEQAQLSAGAVLTMAASGVGNYNYYTLEGRSPDRALLSSADWSTLTAGGKAYQSVAAWLAGATVQDSWCEATHCVLRLQGRGWALWPAREAVNITLPFTPVAARTTDGQRLSVSGATRFLLNQPVFFEIANAVTF
ncbi:glycosyl hydrolase [Caldimonas brevitalea]|uniref:Glycosyl hydrolase n=2 Tax=Caldimonas brevitalea TaxID=413882 RepID=A0A0G3BLL6_9BURK|nr:glycosyl hydrolase [Caldimonas brevitalea]